MADNSPQAASAARLQSMADNSPRHTMQRMPEIGRSGIPVQRQEAQDEELQMKAGPGTLQRQGMEEEDLQMKAGAGPLQRQGMEEEKLQMKAGPGPLQRQGMEDEELQMKAGPDTLQRQGMEEDDLQMKAGAGPLQRQGMEEEDLQMKARPGVPQRLGVEGQQPLQGKVAPVQETANSTGLPDDVKSGVESLSGQSLDDVKVHYNSPKPAALQALAYTQGTDVHVGPGQEKHLPHEAWHVAQQKQGRVKPTMEMAGTQINDSARLEKEADSMGAQAVQRAFLTALDDRPDSSALQRRSPVQRLLTVKDPEGTEYSKIDQPGFVSEARYAIMENKDAIEKADYMDFPGVYGNYLENSGIFGHYLKVLFDSSKDAGTFDLTKVNDLIRLYSLLKMEVFKDIPDAEFTDPTGAPVDSDFTPGKIQFASISGGKVGSIYFPAGRIRLAHGKGPEISKNTGIERFTISESDYQQYKSWNKQRKKTRGMTEEKYVTKWLQSSAEIEADDELDAGECLITVPTDPPKYYSVDEEDYEEYECWKRTKGWSRKQYVQALGSCKVAAVGAAGRLIEFYSTKVHPSRGGPKAFNYNLTQAQLNIIYNGALTKDNGKLKAAMNADSLLKTIPLN